MRISQLFSQTLRENPNEAEIPSHQLLLRAGFIRQLASGIFSYLPLARRSLTKIENIMREEIEAIGGQEVTLPVVHPAEIWQETGRWYRVGSEMGRFKDKNGRDMVLSMTHEEVVADLARKEIRSYNQLPQLIYHIQTKWRDDPRTRAGLIRVREFTMKDSYSLDATWEGLDIQYQAHYRAYFRIFNRCGLPVIAVKADVGMMGGNLSDEFMYITPYGEDTIITCPSCGYSANKQIAKYKKDNLPLEELLDIEYVKTPDTKTIEGLAKFLDIPASKTAKAVFYMALLPDGNKKVERFVFALVRGDADVNETKLANAIHALELRTASDEEIRLTGATPGYGSPIGIKDALVVVDDQIINSYNLVTGANREGYHLRNVNYGRDYQADMVQDIASAQIGFPCPICNQPLEAVRGVEVGNIFKLGTYYSEAMGAFFLDREGIKQPIIMGSYGIGSGRLLACIAEQHHDELGLVWPVTVAPYHVHLIVIRGKQTSPVSSENTSTIADDIYRTLMDNGIEVLFDDREVSPGVKFNDADLIGIPVRLTVSERSIQAGGIEFKLRHLKDKSIISVTETVSTVKMALSELQSNIKITFH